MVFGKCSRAFTRPLYRWLYSARYSATISSDIAGILRWWIRLLRSLPPRVVRFRPRYLDFIITTGASYREGKGGIAAFLFPRESFLADRTATCIAACVGPDYMLKFIGDTLPIFAMGFFIIALAIYEWESVICDKTATLYTEKTGAFGAVLNTGSTATSVDSVDMRLWYLIAQFWISLWLGPVSTDLNIADFPTRDKSPPFASVSYPKFSLLQEAFSFFRTDTNCAIYRRLPI